MIRLSEGNFLGSLRELAQESRISRRLPWPRTTRRDRPPCMGMRQHASSDPDPAVDLQPLLRRHDGRSPTHQQLPGGRRPRTRRYILSCIGTGGGKFVIQELADTRIPSPRAQPSRRLRRRKSLGTRGTSVTGAPGGAPVSNLGGTSVKLGGTSVKLCYWFYWRLVR